MLLILLSLTSLAGAPSPEACARTTWRDVTAGSALVSPDLTESSRLALTSVRDEVSTDLRRCKEKDALVEVPPSCAVDAAPVASTAALARARLRAEALAASDVPTVPTQLTRIRDGQGSAARLEVGVSGNLLPGQRGEAQERQKEVYASVEELESELQRRFALEARIRDAEATWVREARAWNTGRCAAGCATELCAPISAGQERQLQQLRDLYAELSQADADFATNWTVEALVERQKADSEDPAGRTALEARAGVLRAMLADSPARPSAARARLAGVLSTLDDGTRLSETQATQVRAWLTWAATWRRARVSLERDLDRVIAHWTHVDADGPPGPTLQRRMAQDLGRLDARDVPLPANLPGV